MFRSHDNSYVFEWCTGSLRSRRELYFTASFFFFSFFSALESVSSVQYVADGTKTLPGSCLKVWRYQQSYRMCHDRRWQRQCQLKEDMWWTTRRSQDNVRGCSSADLFFSLTYSEYWPDHTQLNLTLVSFICNIERYSNSPTNTGRNVRAQLVGRWLLL